jgi:Flp pilus assembly protein TadD
MTADFSQAMNTARALKSIGNFAESINAYRQAMALQPEAFETLNELGTILWEQGYLDEAVESAKKLVALNPNNPSGHMLMGHVSLERLDFDHCISAYQKAINFLPNHAELFNALGLAYKEMGDFKQAFALYNKALSIEPNNADIHNNRAILLLLMGNLEEGFKEYEWRKLKRERYGNRSFNQVEWRGEELSGKNLLIHHEQGMGDAVQFSRYIKLLQASNFNVLYAAHRPLKCLLSSMGNIQFVDPNDSTLQFDLHCPLLSLPLLLGTTLDTIPADIPYLKAEPERVEKWRKRIGPQGFKIGVAWQGSGGRFATNRLFPTEQFRPLQNLPDVRLIGLHKAPLYAPWELPDGIHIESLGPDFDADSDAFLDSAAAIEVLDLVISCDTAITHIAGAMGKPCWLILRHVPHWVWMMERRDSPWYPSIRLFRQKLPGDWTSAFNEVEATLSDLLSSRDKNGEKF